MDVAEARDLLGVGKHATRQEMQSAYRHVAKEAHPDAVNGSDDKWEALSEAHDLLMSRAESSQELVPLSLALDLVRVQEKGLVLREKQKQRAAKAEATLKSIVRSQTSRLDERKRKAWAVGVGVGGIAIVVTLLRAVALTGIAGEENAVVVLVISLLSVVAGIAAGWGWFFRVQTERLAHFIEDATAQLSDPGQYVQVLNEIEVEGGHSPPWTPGELEEAVDEWSIQIGDFDRRSMGMQALKIGKFDFTRLLIAKGLELELLEEKTRQQSGALSLVYHPASGTGDI